MDVAGGFGVKNWTTEVASSYGMLCSDSIVTRFKIFLTMEIASFI
jgi:hypothetical protein